MFAAPILPPAAETKFAAGQSPRYHRASTALRDSRAPRRLSARTAELRLVDATAIRRACLDGSGLAMGWRARLISSSDGPRWASMRTNRPNGMDMSPMTGLRVSNFTASLCSHSNPHHVSAVAPGTGVFTRPASGSAGSSTGTACRPGATFVITITDALPHALQLANFRVSTCLTKGRHGGHACKPTSRSRPAGALGQQSRATPSARSQSHDT
jgi:hypothetical protein